MKKIVTGVVGAFALAMMAGTALADDTTLTIATVNNGDMTRMQKMTDDFTAANPGIKLSWERWRKMICAKKSPRILPPRVANMT